MKLVIDQTKFHDRVAKKNYAKINLIRVKVRDMTLFMYCLFNDALRNSDYKASNVTLITETQQSKNMTCNEGFLAYSNLLRSHLPGKTEKNLGNLPE
jgi:hypothetical protein